MSQHTHRKHGALEVTGDFQHTSVLFAGATRPNQTQPLHVALHVRNNDTQPIAFTFNTGQRFDLELLDEQGTVVTKWSLGKEFNQMVETIPLQPHSTLTFDADLNVPRKRGQTVVRM